MPIHTAVYYHGNAPAEVALTVLQAFPEAAHDSILQYDLRMYFARLAKAMLRVYPGHVDEPEDPLRNAKDRRQAKQEQF